MKLRSTEELPGKLHPRLIAQNAGSHIQEQAEHQCSRTSAPGVGQREAPTCQAFPAAVQAQACQDVQSNPPLLPSPCRGHGLGIFSSILEYRDLPRRRSWCSSPSLDHPGEVKHLPCSGVTVGALYPGSRTPLHPFLCPQPPAAQTSHAVLTWAPRCHPSDHVLCALIVTASPMAHDHYRLNYHQRPPSPEQRWVVVTSGSNLLLCTGLVRLLGAMPNWTRTSPRTETP